MSERFSQHRCDVSGVKEWDTLQDNVKESTDVQDVELVLEYIRIF